MDLEKISEALQNYTGQEDSMHHVADVLQEELGENWTQTVFQDLQGLAPALKENLNHAFNYYAATMAWNEIQTYLADDKLKRTPELEERLPILKHWLDFFGAPGQSAYKALEDRLETSLDVEQSDQAADDLAAKVEPADVEDESDLSELVDSSSVEDEPLLDEADSELSENQEGDEALADLSEDSTDAVEELAEDEEPEDVEEETPEEDANEEVTSATDPVREKSFDIQKIESQLNLLKQNQAWLAARCIQLKNIEIYAYPFYGFIVDLLRQVLKDMESIQADETKAAAIETDFEGGQEAFDREKESIKHDIELAEQNCESATTALISEDIDMDEVKRTLGTIDDSDTVEYVGPAPDGFELLDDEAPLDEATIKKQYEKIEKMDALTGETEEVDAQNDEMQENTSQNAQKGVQRKLAFSLKRKKPTEGES